MDNRRTFFKKLSMAAASFAILPSAETYERIWKPKTIARAQIWIPNPEYVNAPYEVFFLQGLNRELLVKPELPGEFDVSYPKRYRIDDNSRLVEIPPLVETYA